MIRPLRNLGQGLISLVSDFCCNMYQIPVLTTEARNKVLCDCIKTVLGCLGFSVDEVRYAKRRQLRRSAQEVKSFKKQNPQGKVFRGQNLAGADFSEADIRGVDFTSATLTNANFANAKDGLQPHLTVLFTVLLM